MFYKGRGDSRYAVRTFVFTSIVPIDFVWSKGSGSVRTNSYHSTNFDVILHMSVVYTVVQFLRYFLSYNGQNDSGRKVHENNQNIHYGCRNLT